MGIRAQRFAVEVGIWFLRAALWGVAVAVPLLLIYQPSKIWAACAVMAPLYLAVGMVAAWGDRATRDPWTWIWAVLGTSLGAWLLFAFFHRLTGMGPLYGDVAGRILANLPIFFFAIYTRSPVSNK